MRKSEVSTHRVRRAGLCLGGDFESSPSIVVDGRIMLEQRREIIGYIVMIPQDLTLCSGVLDEWGQIFPVKFVWPVIDNSILHRKLKQMHPRELGDTRTSQC
jgi:hypothetical protein